MPTILSIAFGLASLLIFRKNSGVFPRLARAWLRGLFKFEYDLLIKLPTSLDNIKSDCAKTPTQCVFQSAQKRKNKRHPSAYASKPSSSAVFSLVGVVGFELTTSWSRTKRATPALHPDVRNNLTLKKCNSQSKCFKFGKKYAKIGDEKARARRQNEKNCINNGRDGQHRQ